MARLDDDEIERRLPVWTVLSDTFLDTELGEDYYAHAAECLRDSGYTIVELEAIYRNDVAPAFHSNVWDIAGEWQSWPEEFVRARVLEKRGALFSRLAIRLLFQDYIHDEWQKIASHF